MDSRPDDQRSHVPFPNVAVPQRSEGEISAARSLIRSAWPALRFAGFLLAVGLPLLYFPFAVARLGGDYLLPFLGLFLANVVALVIAYDHARV